MDLVEILSNAIKQEHEASQQYANAAMRASDPETKTLLNQLALDEEQHRLVLEAQIRLLGQMKEMPYPALEITPDQIMRQEYLGAKRLATALLSANQQLKEKQLIYEHDLELAANIQQNLLPNRIPQVPGLQVAAHISMARQVGGDYYDFSTDHAGRFWTTIGDVAGKGIPASLLMTTVRASWRAVATSDTDPGQALKILNQSTYRDFNANESFMTLFTAFYEPAEGQLHFASAGHNPPYLLCSQEDECTELPIMGPIIGISPDMEYGYDTIQLSPGDILVMFTDGLVDARHNEDFFGEERLQKAILENRNASAAALTSAVIKEVNDFQCGLPQTDDITLVVMKVPSI